jgi:N4-gp56 family major capsid protein
MFIPTMWEVDILENLNDKHVYAALLTTEYEGTISEAGDTVRIQSVGRITVSPYVKNSTTISIQNPIGASQVLLIDQSNYFAFEIDDVDKRQQTPKLFHEFTAEAAWAIAETADLDVAAVLSAGVATANTLTAATAVGINAGNDDAYKLLVDLDVRLTESNVPRQNRWVVVPPWFEGLLRMDPKFVSFGTSENLKMLKNGLVGTAAGFTIHVSNNVPNSNGAYDIIAGYKGAAAYAEQLNKTEAYRPQDAFSDALKGLHLYGRKVLRPTGLAKVVATAA